MYSGKLSFSVAILLAFGTIAVSARDCPKACTLEFNQVCASNGKEYRLFDNPCMMDVFNCEHEFLWTRAKSLAPCLADTPAVSADIDDCVRPCTMEYNPICAFDGTSYYSFSNLCEMHNAECGTEKHFEVEANFYNCVPHPAVAKFGCNKPCTREYNPVCGFNGEEHKVFSNQCVMNNEHCNDNKIWTQTRMAECSKPVPFASNVECEKPCTFEYAPVCGSNGFTHEVFPNKCSLENAHCKDGKKWVPTTFTECIEFASVEEKSLNCEKPCNKMYKPVCGTDGQQYKTFDNECIMENEHCKDNHQWKVLPFSVCENPIPLAAAPVPTKECVKPCNKMYAPTCGTDGQEYKVFANQCIMENQHCYDNHQWQVASFALCEKPHQVKEDCIKICPRIYAPVCGSDGQTYKVFDNQCLLEKEAECDGHQWKALPFSVCENPIPLEVAPKKNCPMICPLNYAPICAFNGKTQHIFSNECELEAYNCQNNEHFMATLMTECQANHLEPYPVDEEEEVFACPDNYDPQCGFDGFSYKVFANECMMNGFNSGHKTAQFSHVELSFCKFLLY